MTKAFPECSSGISIQPRMQLQLPKSGHTADPEFFLLFLDLIKTQTGKIRRRELRDAHTP